MKTILFMPTATIDERVKQLEKTCYTKGEENYSRTLTESEIEREKGYYVENGARLKDVEAEAKASAESFNAKKTAIKKEMDEQLERVQTRSRKVYDTLYGVVDNENKTMQFFDKYGELISSRKLTPDEYHGKLFDNDGDAATAQETKQLDYAKPSFYDGDANYEDVKDAEFEEAEKEQENAPAEEPKDEKPTQKPKSPRKTNKKKTSDKDTEEDGKVAKN